jgi:hypothetical protein
MDTMGERIEFALVGEEDDEDELFDLSSPGAGQVFVPHQTLYMAAGDAFARGERLGELDGIVAVGRRGRALCHFVLTFDAGDSLVATGVLAAERSWDDDRFIAITGGTGAYERAAGTIGVRSLNPKRYNVSFQIGG